MNNKENMFLYSPVKPGRSSGEDTQNIEVDTRDNQGPKRVEIKPGVDGAPGEVVRVVRLPESPKPKKK